MKGISTIVCADYETVCTGVAHWLSTGHRLLPEADPGNLPLLARVCREIHTINGHPRHMKIGPRGLATDRHFTPSEGGGVPSPSVATQSDGVPPPEYGSSIKHPWGCPHLRSSTARLLPAITLGLYVP
jgi:hypothetical protein